MNAAPSADRGAPQRSQTTRISRVMGINMRRGEPRRPGAGGGGIAGFSRYFPMMINTPAATARIAMMSDNPEKLR